MDVSRLSSRIAEDGLLNGVQGFNNFRTSILRNFTGGVIKCNDASSTQRVHEGLPVLVYTQGTICS
jgi:hypothetical protein